jgi:hypothetical protein
MSTTMMFAGNLTDRSQLVNGRDGKPSVSYRVAVIHRIETARESVDDVPTGPGVTVCGTTANPFYAAGGFSRVVVNGQPCSAFSREAQERIKQVVSVDDRFGDADLSLKDGVARLEPQTAPAGNTET